MPLLRPGLGRGQIAKVGVLRSERAIVNQSRQQGTKMARFARLTVLNSMIEVGLVPVFHHDDIDTARSIVAA